jgi:UDP-N-acetylmuramate dehydrogenase
MIKINSIQSDKLESAFGQNLQKDVPLGRFTASRIGGLADILIMVESVDQLADAAAILWDLEIPFLIIGGGSNVLISDAGVRDVVILNRAKEIKINEVERSVWTGSGASFGLLARKVSTRGFSGLEWASGIPGTVGGAVYGNAGAHGGDVEGSLHVAEILHQTSGRELWTVEKMGFSYRSSRLKRDAIQAVILSACFQLERSTAQATKKHIEEYAAYRKKTQPPGASMGSMFKNPKDDYAGRLIDQAGLKGVRVGCAEISAVHANFFINKGGAKACDILTLIKLAQKKVYDQFGVELALEIELLGDWGAHAG